MSEEAAKVQGVPPEGQDGKEFLGRDPIGKLLLKLALPTVAQLINMLTISSTAFT